MSDDKMREAFEAWAKSRGYATTRMIDGGYMLLFLGLMFEAYKAGAIGRQADGPLLTYEHDDGRRITCRADDARLVGEPAWHRVGPVEAPTDAGRLDFMIRECAWIVWTKRDGSIRQCQLWTQDSDELIHIVSGESRFFNTARDAIDAAMRATPADGGEG